MTAAAAPSAGPSSAIYAGVARHLRREPRRHAFTKGLFLLYLDLDELEAVLGSLPLCTLEGPGLVSFRRADYLGPPDLPLREAVLGRIEAATGLRPAGPLRMLTHLRFAGYVFNPVTFYYAFGADGTELEALVAEITNTPWGERHAYVLAARDAEREGPDLCWSFDKEFHVSPFHPMEQRYRWRFGVPAERLTVRMGSSEGGRQVFEAELELERRPLTPRSFLGALARHPALPQQVSAAIYFQALRLWLKRIPFHTHPSKRPAPSAARPRGAAGTPP